MANNGWDNWHRIADTDLDKVEFTVSAATMYLLDYFLIKCGQKLTIFVKNPANPRSKPFKLSKLERLVVGYMTVGSAG